MPLTKEASPVKAKVQLTSSPDPVTGNRFNKHISTIEIKESNPVNLENRIAEKIRTGWKVASEVRHTIKDFSHIIPCRIANPQVRHRDRRQKPEGSYYSVIMTREYLDKRNPK